MASILDIAIRELLNEDFDVRNVLNDFNNRDAIRSDEQLSIAENTNPCDRSVDASLPLPTNDFDNRRDTDYELSGDWIDDWLTRHACDLPDELIDDIEQYEHLFVTNDHKQNVESDQSAHQKQSIDSWLAPEPQHQIEIAVQTQASIDADIIAPTVAHTNTATVNNRKRKAGRYSLTERGFTPEQQRERQLEQNRRAQQKRRDRRKASERNERNERNANAIIENCYVVRSVVIDPQNGFTLYGVRRNVTRI